MGGRPGPSARRAPSRAHPGSRRGQTRTAKRGVTHGAGPGAGLGRGLRRRRVGRALGQPRKHGRGGAGERARWGRAGRAERPGTEGPGWSGAPRDGPALRAPLAAATSPARELRSPRAAALASAAGAGAEGAGARKAAGGLARNWGWKARGGGGPRASGPQLGAVVLPAAVGAVRAAHGRGRAFKAAVHVLSGACGLPCWLGPPWHSPQGAALQGLQGRRGSCEEPGWGLELAISLLAVSGCFFQALTAVGRLPVSSF